MCPFNLLGLLLCDSSRGLPSPFITLSVMITAQTVVKSLNDSDISYLIREALFTQKYLSGAINNDVKVNAK